MKFRFFLVISLSLALCGCSRYYPDEISLEDYEERGVTAEVSGDDVSETVTEQGKDKEAHIYVYVCGEVASPGVYELAAGSRVYEAIELAGGVTAEGDIAYINQAELCYDGEKLYVPKEGEYTAGYDGADAAKTSDSRININTADSKELQEIKGIGEARASDIISYREKNGNFTRVEDIMGVPGIKQGTFDKIKDQIKV